MNRRPFLTPFVLLVMLLSQAFAAQAYVGPGVGATFFGSLLGLVIGFVITVGLVLFWPIRRIIKKIKSKSPNSATAGSPQSADHKPG